MKTDSVVERPRDVVSQLSRRIQGRDAVVGVVGQGYVGFPLAQEIAAAGFVTYGYDVRQEAVASCLERNRSKRYHAVDSAEFLSRCDVVVVAVPTPTVTAGGRQSPDLSLVVAATRNALAHLADDGGARLLILESTYSPGTTRNVVAPLVKQYFRAGTKIAIGYSPERIDPGNPSFSVSNTPKIVSGLDDVASDLTRVFYEQFIHQVVEASSVEAAEAAKMLENTFRFINIAFAQEFDEYCAAAGLNSREVTELAATKPFGYMPFFAGAGIGGHCIAEDPYFLLETMREAGSPAGLLEAAVANHESRARLLADRVQAALPGDLRGVRVLLLGVSYKPEIADTRKSPALGILRELEARGASVSFADPYVAEFAGRRSLPVAMVSSREFDIAVLVTAHRCFSAEELRAHGWPLVDLRESVQPRHVSENGNAEQGDGRAVEASGTGRKSNHTQLWEVRAWTSEQSA